MVSLNKELLLYPIEYMPGDVFCCVYENRNFQLTQFKFNEAQKCPRYSEKKFTDSIAP